MIAQGGGGDGGGRGSGWLGGSGGWRSTHLVAPEKIGDALVAAVCSAKERLAPDRGVDDGVVELGGGGGWEGGGWGGRRLGRLGGRRWGGRRWGGWEAGAPEAMLEAKNCQNSVLGLYFGNMALMVSLKAKLNACVGKYRMTLTVLPRQKAEKPCSDDTRVKQSTMPVYRLTSPEMIFGLASWVWISSFTRSIGAVQVFATAPATPPAKKSFRKATVLEPSAGAGAAKAPVAVRSWRFCTLMGCIGLPRGRAREVSNANRQKPSPCAHRSPLYCALSRLGRLGLICSGPQRAMCAIIHCRG